MGLDAHLRVPVRVEVGTDQEAVVIHQRIDQPGVTGRIIRREHPATNRLQHIIESMGRGDVRHRTELMVLFARLNLLHTVALYQAIRAEPEIDWVPRVKIFAGKAAASYHQAKLIIKLTNDIARTVNNDPTVRGLLKVVFLPNYNVSLAESIIPAADLSEQISTAGFEASGTSNMKFGLNGALTIGTLDGANVEMCERVGAEHMFIFGLSAQQVEARKRNGEFSAVPDIASSHRLNDVLQAIRGGVFSPDDPSRYTGLIDSLVDYDRFLVCADFDSYWAAQARVEERWHDSKEWWRSAVLNSARMGWFSSDRTIREYATEIWKALE